MQWLLDFFTAKRLKPGEVAIGATELAILRDHVGKAKYPALITHIKFMAKYTPRREVKEANDAFLYILEFASESDPATRKWPTPQAFIDEMERRRGSINAAHIASRAGGENVIAGNFITKVKLEPDKVLHKAIGHLQDVVIVGYDKEGGEYFASSYADGGEVLWHLERGKHRLMALVDDLSKQGKPQ